MHMPTAAMIAFAMPTLVGVLAQVTDRPDRSLPAEILASDPDQTPSAVTPPTNTPLTRSTLKRAMTPSETGAARTPTARPAPARVSPLTRLDAPVLRTTSSLREPRATALLAGDSYTCEALAQDATSAYFIDDENSTVFHFDGAVEIGGASALDPNAIFIIYEARTELENTTLIQIELGAYNPNGEGMPWVDESAAGFGLDSWRMDIGTADINDPDPITLEAPFTVVASGMAAFGTDGSLLGEAGLLRDDSTSTGLAGVATVGLGGEDIAGFELAAIQMWWEVKFDSTTTDPGECPADMNADGYVDIADIQAFISSFLTGCK